MIKKKPGEGQEGYSEEVVKKNDFSEYVKLINREEESVINFGKLLCEMVSHPVTGNNYEKSIYFRVPLGVSFISSIWPIAFYKC